jgi:hypothetical protein
MSKTEMSQDEVMSAIESNIKGSQIELKDHLKLLKHGHKERLLVAISEYPIVDLDVTGEEKAFQDAYACLKRIQDSQVALAVEVVIQQMARNHGISQEEKNG